MPSGHRLGLSARGIANRSRWAWWVGASWPLRPSPNEQPIEQALRSQASLRRLWTSPWGFRFTSGKLARLAKRDVTIRLATDTAGIRGTDVWGPIEPGRDFV